jgi:hypothetical protein
MRRQAHHSGVSRPLIPTNSPKWSVSSGMSGRLGPEWLVDFLRNRWSVSSGMGGRFAPEYALGVSSPRVKRIPWACLILLFTVLPCRTDRPQPRHLSSVLTACVSRHYNARTTLAAPCPGRCTPKRVKVSSSGVNWAKAIDDSGHPVVTCGYKSSTKYTQGGTEQDG